MTLDWVFEALAHVRASRLAAAHERACHACGDTARIKEKTSTRVYCHLDCAALHWTWRDLLALGQPGGMKRLRPLPQRDTVFLDLPDDVLVELILVHSYRFVIETPQEMNDLLAIREISARFTRLIDERVIPRIARLGQPVLEVISGETIVRFVGLVEIGVGFGAARITGQTLLLFTHLRTLRLGFSHLVSAQHLVQLTGLTALEESWEAGTIDDATLRSLTHLQHLDMGVARAVTDAGLAPLRNLTFLGAHPAIGDAGIAPLTQLQTLQLRTGTNVTDAGLGVLTNLTELSVRFHGQMLITDRSVSLLTRLTRLFLDGNAPITDLGIATLIGLRDLTLRRNWTIEGGHIWSADAIDSARFGGREH